MFVETQCAIHGTEYRIHKTAMGLIIDPYCGECEAERPFNPTEYYYPRERSRDLDTNETNETWDDEE